MKTFKIAAIALFSVACIQIPVSAACGGGGWHKSKPAAVVEAAPTVDAEYVTQARISDRHAEKQSLDTARFDAVSSQLQLSDRQFKDVRQAEDDIRDRLNGLYDAKVKAETKYANCTGNCDKERRNLDQANSAYYNFVPNREFDRRLSSLLNDRQMKIYQNNDRR